MGFQSTLPLRGVTGDDFGDVTVDLLFQSPLPLRGVTGKSGLRQSAGCKFQSTLPLRGVTQLLEVTGSDTEISIHTPLAGSDGNSAGNGETHIDFNPHSPCGE